MSSATNGQAGPLWRLDSLADAARSKEWQAAAAAAEAEAEQQTDRPADTMKKKKKNGLFDSFREFVADLMPFGLNSTVKGTQRNLQRLMTLQIAAMPEDMPAGEGFDTLEENPAGFDAFDSIEEEPSLPSVAAAQTAAADAPAAADASAGQDSTDLVAAADAALAAAAADSVLTAVESPNASRQGSVESPNSLPSGDFACPRRHSSLAGGFSASAFAAAVPSTLRSGSEESVGLQALQGLQVMPSRRHSVLLGMKSMRSTGLARASTLKMMESSHAWEELKGIQDLQQGPEPADPTDSLSAHSGGKATAATAAAAAESSSRDKQLQQNHDKQKEGKGLSGSFARALAGLSVGSLSSAVTSRISSMLTTQAPGAAFSTTIKKTAHTTLSTDGWTLHLVHCTDTSLHPGQRKTHPILMCPGLASSGPGTFDLLSHVSICEFLAASGWDCWVIDIRGNGLADKSSRIDIEQDWNIDDYLVQDVPACMEYVLKHSPCNADKLHWIGHSMGGMLGSGLCSQAGKWGKRLRSVTLMGSGCFGDGSWHVLLKKLVVPVTSFGFPAHITTQGLALLANTPVALSVFETLFYWPANVEKPIRKALLATAFNFIPAKLVGQFLDSHGSASGLTNCRGNFLYADPDVLGMCKVPVLGVNGDWDLFCPAAGGARNVDLFAGPKKHITVGPAFGQQAHYGHFDVIVGHNAQQEVWPHLTAFLKQHDAPARLRQLWDARLLSEGEV